MCRWLKRDPSRKSGHFHWKTIEKHPQIPPQRCLKRIKRRSGRHGADALKILWRILESWGDSRGFIVSSKFLSLFPVMDRADYFEGLTG